MLGWLKRKPQDSAGLAYTRAAEAAWWGAIHRNLTADRLATSEACANLLARGLLTGELAGADGVEMTDMAIAFHALARDGEAILYPVNGRMIAACGWEVSGEGYDPMGWRYRLDLPSPGSTRSVTTDGRFVLHFRDRVAAAQPWRGRSPLEDVDGTRELIARLESALCEEAAFRSQKFLQLPQSSAPVTHDQQGSFGESIQRLGDGSLGIIGVKDLGFDQATNPRADLVQVRPAPDSMAVQLRTELRNEICAAYGIPPVMLGYAAGDLQRASRLYLAFTLRPLARVVERELRVKRYPQASITFRSLLRADIAATARAFKSLKDAKLDDAEAREAVGLE